MIKKYIMPQFMLLCLLIATKPVYTIAQESLDEDETLVVSKDFIRFNAAQQAAFDEVKQQTHQILTSLQQLEQVLATDKIKFDTTKGLKKEILKEIDGIKTTIETLFNVYTTEQAFSQGFINGIVINKMSIDYVLPCLLKDITTISMNEFDKRIAAQYPEHFDKITENYDFLKKINDENHLRIQELRIAADNVGLTTCNKAFRYFQDVPMSLTGVPLMTTAQNTAFGLSLAALIYTIAVYTVPLKGELKIDNAYLKFNFKFSDLKYKNFIGSQELTVPAMQGTGSDKDFGFGNHIERIFRESSSNPITVAGLTYVASNTQSIYESAIKYSEETYDSMISYMRGEMNEGKGFNRQQNDVYFKDMINSEQLEAFALELADYMKHPARYENSGTAPATGILLAGPSQTGKSYYAQAIRTLINDELKKDNNYEMKFWNVTKEEVTQYGIRRIFAWARYDAPCILFFDEIDMIGAHRDTDKKISSELLTNMSGLLNNKNKKVIVIAATNVPDQLDQALLQDGRIGKQFQFELPSFQHRKEYLMKSLSKKNIKSLSMDDIDMIAYETDGHTYNTLNKIIATALRFAIFKSRLVTKQDFQDAIDTDLRHIRKNSSLTDDEKKIIAIYQSGQAAARHILSTSQEVIKITIDSIEKQAKGSFSLQKPAPVGQTPNQSYIRYEKPKPIKNGHVFTLNIKNNNEFLDDQEQENELLALLAGQAALELVTGKTFSNFGKEDRAIILHALEVKISQGNHVNDDIRKQAIVDKDALYQKIKTILEPHIQFIHDITQQLVQQRSINKDQWTELVKNYTV